MDKTYSPQEIEERWYKFWEENGYFRPDIRNQDAPPYCIMIPPPNVTGSLHMGHGFNNTIMDTLTRYQRMTGRPTLWQPGTDHAGIATQMVVERRLEKEGETRHTIGREKFIERIREWREESGGNITRQLRRIGSSLDWEHERFTMDEGLSRTVREVFIRLYEEGLIYRGRRLVNWDPVLHTAISDLEVISEEEDGHMWYIRYPLANGTGHLVVATTRPETMLGDCAVAVNPADTRFRHMVGELLELPLTRRKIPVIADEHVDIEFGTGCIKVTPAHDFNDYAIWQRHRDEVAINDQAHGGLINIFTVNAAIRTNEESEKDLIPAAYVGMDRYQARKQIVADLKTQNLLEQVREHKLMVPRGDRSGTVIEPLLTRQWYVRVSPLAEPAVRAVEDGTVRFVPDGWKNTYFSWMRDIQDWCISRQIWWGHRIPAWYDKAGNVYVGHSEQAIRNQHNLADNHELHQDEDVLDTWFSSALWPFSTLGWPDNTERLKTFYPTSVLVTGFDIIFFWVARMMMMGLKFMDGKPPFKEIYIHGLVRDSHGDKMAKSKGNVLDPIDLIDGIDLESLVQKRTTGMMQPHLAKKIAKQTRQEFPDGIQAFGTDALRFTFAAMASAGRDIKFDMSRIEGYRNFCNKLWNAARYVLMNAEGPNYDPDSQVKLSTADQWITSRLQETIRSMTDAINSYRFDHMAQAVYDFTWNEYCAWYLELSKTILNDDTADDAQKHGTRRTMITTLESVLRLAHPVIPYITEEIWQTIAPTAGINGDTIMLQRYPRYDESLINMKATREIQWTQDFILGVRRIKSEMDIAPGKAVSILLANTSYSDRVRLETARPYIKFLTRAENISIINDEDDVPEAAIALVGTMKILIPLAGLIDKDAELVRLQKEINRLEDQVKRLDGKLANNSFLTRAPEVIVNGEREKLANAKTALENLNEQKKRIEQL